ncbi:MAG TPA: MGMT family protein [Anaerolineales bacterium]|nr:MGMT family protein [Anaerolineales bacterium]
MTFISPSEPDVFDQEVWRIVAKIPPGKVTTYGKIAELITPKLREEPRRMLAMGARWVGGSMARCPEGYPWHRVVNAKGETSLRSGAFLQRELLEAEGIQFLPSGKIDLGKYSWLINSE